MGILALTIVLNGWKILLCITVITLIMAVIGDCMQEGGSYMPSIPVWTPIWLVLNLIMWCSYFAAT